MYILWIYNYSNFYLMFNELLKLTLVNYYRGYNTDMLSICKFYKILEQRCSCTFKHYCNLRIQELGITLNE